MKGRISPEGALRLERAVQPSCISMLQQLFRARQLGAHKQDYISKYRVAAHDVTTVTQQT